jgi:hypothetical protein
LIFHGRTREPLLPPPSAVINKLDASGYKTLPILVHHRRMLSTANSAVSLSVPTSPFSFSGKNPLAQSQHLVKLFSEKILNAG